MPSTKPRTQPGKRPTAKSGSVKKTSVRGKKPAKKDKPRDEDADIEKNAEELDHLGDSGETALEDDEEGGDDEEEVEPKIPGEDEETEEVEDRVAKDPKDLESVDADFGFDEDDELGKVEAEDDEEKDDEKDEDEEDVEPEDDDGADEGDLDSGRGEKEEE